MERNRKMNWGLLGLAIPGLVLLIAFYYAPLFGLIIPFKKIDYAKGIWRSDWIGLKNFDFFFKSQDALRVTRNTLMLNALFIAITMVLAVTLSLMLFQLQKRQVKIYMTAMFVPYFVSWVVASYIVYAILNPTIGLLPLFMKSQGQTSPNFYAEPKYWPLILTLCYIWKNVGYMTLLFYAVLMGVDQTQFEAAAIDGAGRWMTTIRISLPFLQPTILLLTILQVGKIFYSDFGMFYFLTRNAGALYSTTNVIDTYVFNALRRAGDIGMSSAVGLYQSVVGFALVLVSNLFVRRINKESSIF
jgi:putative aldouronate transport system permease protein